MRRFLVLCLRMTQDKVYKKVVKTWLLVGVVMVFVQIVLGGVTRLTGSGLSITKWDIATGTIPPLSAEDWSLEFELYKATPQYRKINEGMTVKEFKFIYFWEYIHRLWARTMGFVFLFPFLFFLYKKWIDRRLLKRLLGVVLLAVVVAFFGWIMVASGLINRPWVNAYKLTLHLNLGLLLFGFLFWTYLYTVDPVRTAVKNSKLNSMLVAVFLVLVLQLLLGGIMSGMKAGLYYPSWPDMNGQIIPGVLLDKGNWRAHSFVDYDNYALAPAFVQFFHRLAAYVLFGMIGLFGIRVRKLNVVRWYRNGSLVLIAALLIQLVLGIYTVVNCIGKIPLFLGVMHQVGAIVLLTSLLYMIRSTIRE
jgi:heme a synthase